MSSISVHLEVPKRIEMGLESGTMERVGGVVRNSGNKRIVAWLREGGKIGQAAEPAAGLLERVMSLSGSRYASLGKVVSGAFPLLSIAMAGYTLLEHIEGIRAHEAEIEHIFDRVTVEFQRDREVDLFATLDYAENVFATGSDELKREAVAFVAYALAVSRSQLVKDLEGQLGAETSEKQLARTLSYQVLAMKVCAMSVRVRLEVGEEEAAIDWLSKCVTGHKKLARNFVRKWIGNRPALYFHESVSDEHLERFLDIERWLHERRDVLKEVIFQNRKYFWNDKAIEALYTRSGLNTVLMEEPFYLVSLPHAEILIENFQRLQGFELELKSLRSSFKEWEAFNSSLIDNHDGYVMLVSDEQSAGTNESSS
ncbi:MAG: hypothetical protein OXG39_12880 [Chloroflexi bacterium]|nr:hypothetical protein [Chloroflexota bacterium]